MSGDINFPVQSDSEPSAPVPAAQPSSPARTSFWQEWLMPIGVLIGIFALMFLAALLVPRLRPATHSGQEPASFPKRLLFTSPLDPAAYTPALVVEGEARLPALPQTLDVGGTTFTVAPVKPELGHWPIPADPHQAGWLYGTLVNYVLGLPYSEENLALLQRLGGSAQVTLTLDNGVQLQFGSPQLALRLPEAALFEQRQPGLTLVLLGGPEGDEARWVLRASYLPSLPVIVGQAQAVGDMLITVTRVELIERKPERWLVVDYQLSHNGETPLEPAQLTLLLEDGRGLRYQPEMGLGPEGHPAPFNAPLAPGITLSASASYRLADAPTLPLAWIVHLTGEKPALARFPLGYVPPQPAPAQAVVSVKQALYEPEQNAVRISGTVRNAGELALTVNGTRILLKSSQGVATLRSFSPLLPWSLGAGEQETFEAVFERPAGAQELTFELLGFVYRLSGLP